jgi:pyruvate dehydrogenase E1 component
MFGFQRVGDLIWAAGDIRRAAFCWAAPPAAPPWPAKGLQHQDGHSHLLAYPNPTVQAYDPAFAYELAVIVKEGLRRMLEEGENIIYYLTIMNEFYKMPPKPEGVDEGILGGIYRFQSFGTKARKAKVHLFGSGTILNEVSRPGRSWKKNMDFPADVWSVTSYKKLYWDAIDTERWNLRHPDRRPACFLQRQLG